MTRHRPPIGSFEWTEATAGVMSWRDRLTVVGMLARAQVQDCWERSSLRRRWLTERLQRLDLNAVRLPDSPLVRQAVEQVAACYSSPLLAHCYRCYYWGQLLAQFAARRLDAELFLVAVLFHDLGLSDPFLPLARSECFTRTGACLGAQFVRDRGWEEKQARQVYEAISLHLNPLIDARRYGVEASLVGAAAALDLLGWRSHRIPVPLVHTVQARYGRAGCAAEMIARNANPQLHRAGTRSRFYTRFGSGRLFARNRLDYL
jgi:hypothetical protein